MKRTFFITIEGEPCGEITLNPTSFLGISFPPSGHIFVCRICARIWAVAISPGSDNLVHTIPCEGCGKRNPHFPGHTSFVAGSVLLGYSGHHPDWTVDLLPSAVLLREARLYLERWKAPETVAQEPEVPVHSRVPAQPPSVIVPL